MTADLVIESSPGEARAARLEDGTLTDFAAFRRTDGPRLGDIYLGRVQRVERGFDAAFVDIGTGPAGFLPLRGKRRTMSEGAAVAVRIAAEAVAGKGPRLAFTGSHEAETKSAKPPACLKRDGDLVAAAVSAFIGSDPERIIAADTETLARLRALGRESGWAGRIEVHDASGDAFAELGIEEQLEAALGARVSLAPGLAVHIGELEALAAIDVDAAAFTPRRGTRASALAANLAAVPDIARLVRLRNLSGLVLIDFPRMKSAGERKRLIEALKRALAADPVPAHIHGFTRAGLVEITRERRRRPLSQVLLERGAAPRQSAETVALGALRAALRLARPGRGVRLAAAPEVIAWLEGEGRPDARAAEAALHVPLTLAAEPGFARERYELAAG